MKYLLAVFIFTSTPAIAQDIHGNVNDPIGKIISNHENQKHEFEEAAKMASETIRDLKKES